MAIGGIERKDSNVQRRERQKKRSAEGWRKNTVMLHKEREEGRVGGGGGGRDTKGTEL
jgi:hypothetical protein